MRKVISIILLLLLIGCESTSKPKNLLSEEEMIDVLYDLTLYQSLKNYNFNKDTLTLNGTLDDLLAKHGIDSTAFVEQNAYYLKDMKKYARMYDTVAERLKVHLEEKKLKVIEENKKNPTLFLNEIEDQLVY